MVLFINTDKQIDPFFRMRGGTNGNQRKQKVHNWPSSAHARKSKLQPMRGYVGDEREGRTKINTTSDRKK